MSLPQTAAPVDHEEYHFTVLERMRRQLARAWQEGRDAPADATNPYGTVTP